MALTDRMILALKPLDKPRKYFDGGGLYLLVTPPGGKLWRLAYRFNGKAKLLSFGAYPAVTLKMARDRRDEAKSLIARDIDPGEHKKDLKPEQRIHNLGHEFLVYGFFVLTQSIVYVAFTLTHEIRAKARHLDCFCLTDTTVSLFFVTRNVRCLPHD